MQITLQPTITLDTIILSIATGLIACATYLMYKATRESTKSQIRPRVIAWLREKERGLGIYVQSVGLGPAYNGRIALRTYSGTVEYGSVNYDFTRMFITQRYEYPIEGQPAIPFSAAQGITKMTIEIRYEDINGNQYHEETEVEISNQTPLGQV